MRRDWLKLGMAILFSGCHPLPHAATPASEVLGCFEVEPSTRFSSVLPRRIELRPSPSPCPHAKGKLWAVDPHAHEESKVHGHWLQSPDGAVKISWGEDFRGIAAEVRSLRDGMAGTAHVFRDVGEDGPTGALFLKRVACGK
jgi:hypothetical protein